MEVVFTYLPIRLKDVTETYLKYSIENLNEVGIVPIIYADDDYFHNTNLKYRWIPFDIDSKYKIDTLWSYPKLKVLSIIDIPFIHLDNDVVVEDFTKLKSILKPQSLNLCYKHPINDTTSFIEIFKRYSDSHLDFTFLNNTSIIATNNYELINKSYCEVLDIVDTHYDFFSKRYNTIPPVTLNQQYPNLYFNNINYLYDTNPEFEELDRLGVCHMADKQLSSRFIKTKKLI